MHIDTDEHDPLLVFLDETLGELRGRRCLARALQSREQNHRWRLRFQIQRRMVAAKYGHELVVDNLDERLPWRKALRNLLAHGPGNATSASSSASRTCRSVSLMLASVSRPLPLRLRAASDSLPVRFSNMARSLPKVCDEPLFRGT